MRKTEAGIIAAAVVALALPLVQLWEGRSLVAYRDIAGIPTICDGETRGVKMGDRATPAECDAMTEAAVAEFERAIRPCLPRSLPTETRAAFVVTAYNIGASAFCGSSMSRRALAGDLRGACDALMLWNKARVNGQLQVVRGLTNRRAAERALCLRGLT
jgi:lysozyme